MKTILLITFLFLVSCGDVKLDNSSNSLNSRFLTSELNDVSSDEKALKVNLCGYLAVKKDLYKRSYLTKTFVYSASKKECDEEQSTEKVINLTLEESGNTIKFESTIDDFYAFLNLEFNDNLSVFSKFCSDLNTNDRFIDLNSSEVAYFELRERSNRIEAKVTTSFFDEDGANGRYYKVYKVETLDYNTKEEPNRPLGLVTSRVLESVSGCDGVNVFEKSNTLNQIRD